MHLSWIDIVIILVYIIGIIIYGIKKGKSGTSEEYFLGGKSMTWPVIGLSMFAANISSNSLVAIPGAAYNNGISVFNYEWMASVVLFIFCVFILPFYIKSGIYTIPQYFEKRFDVRSRYYFSFITLVGNIFIDTAGTLYAGYKTISFVIGGNVNPYLIVGALGIFAASYTTFGGLSSVMQTEVINTIILLFSAIVLAVIVFIKGGDWTHIVQTAEQKGDHFMHLILPNSNTSMPWLGLVLGVPMLGFYFWCNNQFIVQRALSAKNIDEGRKGAMFAAFLKLPVLFLLVFPGIIALKLLPDLKNSSEVFPRFIFEYLPIGLIGLTVAGFLAAMSSAVSATLNSASTLVTMDFIQKAYPNMSSKNAVKSGQIATIIFMFIAVLWAPQIDKASSLMDYMQTVLSLISPPIVAVFVAGIFSKRATPQAAFVSLMTGFVLGITVLVLYTYKVPFIVSLPFLFQAPILFVICFAIVFFVSRFTTPRDEAELKDIVWSKEILNADTKELQGKPWYQNYRTIGWIILFLTGVIVWIYR